eukprot:SM000001S04702  [mRNA]  locus=s1:1762130:1764021:- [translate_table: standard]
MAAAAAAEAVAAARTGCAPTRAAGTAISHAAQSATSCDETCDETCDNTRIYIENLPTDVTIDELKDLFGARIKQKRGYKDQWPWNIKLYQDEGGKPKGDAALTYEDPQAAHSAGGFFNNHELRGKQIKVTMAAKSAPRPPAGGGYGRGGGFRGGGRGYGGGGGGGGGGPDRGGDRGYRSRPY